MVASTSPPSPSSDCLSIFHESDTSTSLAVVNSNNAFENKQLKSRAKQNLIATAVVWVYDNAGFRVPCRVVLDSASHAHFITEDFCQKLNIQRKPSTSLITGICEANAKPRQMVTLLISSRFSTQHCAIGLRKIARIKK